MLVNEVPFIEEDSVCRFEGCSHPALGEYTTPNGCACYPDDRQQKLCVQHAITAEPLGEMKLTTIFNLSLYEDLLFCR